MKLQDASKKEIKRIALGTGLGLVLMLAVFAALSLFGIGTFDYTVILSAVIGGGIAIGNFTLLCLTIQKAAGIEDKKQMKARFQLSYHARLMTQAAWVVAAFLLPCFNAVAAAIPLLFPTATIYLTSLRIKTGGR